MWEPINKFPLPVQNPPTGFRPIGPSSGRYLKKYKLPTVQAKSSEVTGKENPGLGVGFRGSSEQGRQDRLVRVKDCH